MKMQFNIAEKGVGSYRSLSILRWVMGVWNPEIHAAIGAWNRALHKQ